MIIDNIDKNESDKSPMQRLTESLGVIFVGEDLADVTRALGFVFGEILYTLGSEKEDINKDELINKYIETLRLIIIRRYDFIENCYKKFDKISIDDDE